MRASGLAVALVSVVACKDGGSEANRPAVPEAPAARVEQALARIVATCAEASGVVEVRRKGQPQWDRVAVGAVFRERDFVRTGDGGFVRIRFSAGGFLDLREHTTILVDTAIVVDAGTLVGAATADQPITVRAADGSEARIVASAEGPPAEFRLTAVGGSGLEIAVTKGSVKLIAKDGEQAIAAGEASDLRANQASAIVKLLGFPKSMSPGVDARFEFEAGKQIAVAWGTLPGAARYHVQIARDTEFRELVLDAATPVPNAAFTPTAVGAYMWRAAGVDANGRVGEFGFARRMFFEADAPQDLLLAPHDGVKVGFADKFPRITFSWQSAGATRNYRLVIGRGASPLVDPVVSIPTKKQQVEVGTLREGSYRWGVYALHDKEEVPIFLSPRTLTISKQRVKAHTDKLWDKPER